VHTGLNKAATGSSDQNVSQSCHWWWNSQARI